MSPARQPIRYRSAPASSAARLYARLVRAADRLGLPASEQVSRRSLWGLCRRGGVSAPDGGKQLALSFDLDYQADTDALPQLVALLGRVGVRATLFSIGRLVEQDPAPYRRALAAGHEIGNHTWSHPDNPVLNPDNEFWHLSTAAMASEIGQAQRVFERLLGTRPTGFRTPHFKDAHRMLAALEDFPELRYVSSALASKAPLGVPYFPSKARVAGNFSLNYSCIEPDDNSRLLMIPLTPCPAHRWSPFCSYHGIRRPPVSGAGLHDPASFVSLWRRMLNDAEADGFANVYFDPFDVMRDQQTAHMFENMLVWAREQGWAVDALDTVEAVWRRELAAEHARGGGRAA